MVPEGLTSGPWYIQWECVAEGATPGSLITPAVCLCQQHTLTEVAAALWVDVPSLLSPGRAGGAPGCMGVGRLYSPVILVTWSLELSTITIIVVIIITWQLHRKRLLTVQFCIFIFLFPLPQAWPQVCDICWPVSSPSHTNRHKHALHELSQLPFTHFRRHRQKKLYFCLKIFCRKPFPSGFSIQTFFFFSQQVQFSALMPHKQTPSVAKRLCFNCE